MVNILDCTMNCQRWSRGHKARGQGQGHKKKKIRGQGQGQPFRGQTKDFRGQGQECSRPRPRPRTQAQVLSKKKKGLHKNFSGDLQKKRSSHKFFKRSPQNNVFQKIFQALRKILTIQKIVLSSSRGQANFRGLETSRPRPRT